MTDETSYCGKLPTEMSCDRDCHVCVFARMSTKQNQVARKEFFYQCFPDERPRKESCSECANYKPKEELPKLTQEVFEREGCPEWAHWAAVGKDGRAWWFEDRPFIPSDLLPVPGWITSWQCKEIPSITAPFDATDWEHSLIEREIKVKPVNYRIIKETSTPALESALAHWLVCGWRPQGGISFDSSDGVYMQAVVKKED